MLTTAAWRLVINRHMGAITLEKLGHEIEGVFIDVSLGANPCRACDGGGGAAGKTGKNDQKTKKSAARTHCASQPATLLSQMPCNIGYQIPQRDASRKTAYFLLHSHYACDRVYPGCT
ncbi:hypothetical protein [Nisaea sp.]|uniref:hypothetical protein n=1 Tax=Nisaea sp. TaxID=2024842 RepID=UPI0032EBE4B8